MKNFKNKSEKKYSYPFEERDEKFLRCFFGTDLLYMILEGTIIVAYVVFMIFRYQRYYTILFVLSQIIFGISYFCVKAKYLAYEDIKYIRDKLYEEEEKDEKNEKNEK